MHLHRKDLNLAKVKPFRECFDNYAELQVNRFKSYEAEFTSAMKLALAYEKTLPKRARSTVLAIAPETADDAKVKGIKHLHLSSRLQCSI